MGAATALLYLAENKPPVSNFEKNANDKKALGDDDVRRAGKVVEDGDDGDDAAKPLRNVNFHRKIGGAVNEPKFRRKSNNWTAYDEEMALEDELWEEEQA